MPKVRVEKPGDVPAGDHFVIMEYRQESKYDPPYNSHDSGGHSYYIATYHYVYTNRDEWARDVEQMYRSEPKRTDFAFFEAGGRGSLQVQVMVAAPARR